MSSENTFQSFEAALNELESLLDLLEKGELSLEDSLSTFERGVQLTRSCDSALRDAEQKVQRLSSLDQEADLEPYDSDE